MSSDREQAIVSKIEALFRQANHPGTGEAERNAFHAKALALMEKHRIQVVASDLDLDEEPAQYGFGQVKGSYASAIHQIVDAVANMYSCRSYYRSSGRPGDPTRHVLLFGFKNDVDRVKTLANLFIDDAKTQAARHKTSDPNTTIRWRKSFMFGYAAEIRSRYAEAKQSVERESNPIYNAAALVLVERDKQVEQAFSKMKFRRGAGSRGFSADGYAAGQAAGKNTNIGRGRVGGSRAAIGR